MLCDPVSRSSPALQQELAGNGDSSLCRSTQRTVAVKKHEPSTLLLLSRTMFDFGSFSSIAVGEGPHFLVSGRSSAESSGVNLHCLPGLAALPAAGSECNVHFDLATTFGVVYVDVLRYIRNGAHVQTSDGSSEARRMYGSHVPRSDVAAASHLGLI